MKTELTDGHIAALAVANGFKLKAQPDGTDALNPYVFDFARAIIQADRAQRQAGQEPAIRVTHVELSPQQRESLRCKNEVRISGAAPQQDPPKGWMPDALRRAGFNRK